MRGRGLREEGKEGVWWQGEDGRVSVGRERVGRREARECNH